ncbi:MAG: ABC transporter permease [Actinomycetales bacterium]
MSTVTTTPTGREERRVPSLGAFNLRFVQLEMRRLLRNRRTVIFTFIMPPVFFLLFGSDSSYEHQSVGNGNVTAYVMISLAVYGAMLATTSGGAMVAIERAAGWSRQLRLTPLRPGAYITIKGVTAMILGLAPVVLVFVLGSARGAHMHTALWVITPVIAWVGSVVFAAFGLFMGYLLPSENVMQFLGPVLALLAFAGGVFVPVDQMSQTFQDFAKVTPMYGLSQVVHAPLTGEAFQIGWVLSILAWLAIFAVGAAWRFRKDTARV